MRALKTTALVIGAGPGGYTAALRLAQHGVATTLVEQEALGGTCLNVGCIPSKALIHASETVHRLRTLSSDRSGGISVSDVSCDAAALSADRQRIVARLNQGVRHLLKRARVTVLSGRATLRNATTCRVTGPDGEVDVSTEHLVIATGSEPVPHPTISFGPRVLSSSTALALTEIPKSLAVVGGGYIGVELGTAFAKLGTRVAIIEAGERLLPSYDDDLVRLVNARLGELKVAVRTGCRAEAYDERSGQVSATGNDGVRSTLTSEFLLMTIGRRPRSDGIGLEHLGLRMRGAAIAIDERCQTSMRNVWAVGDVTGEPMLAHRATAQADVVADAIAGRPALFDKRAIPAICFADPELVQVGLPSHERKLRFPDAVVGQFPFAANGRAMTRHDDRGFVRVTAHPKTHAILSIEAVGAGVSELAAAFALAIEMGARLEDVAATIHAHPTLGEAFPEAAFKALGTPLHV